MSSVSFVSKLKEVLGKDRVLSLPGELFPYAYDAALDKRLPGAVVLPRTSAEVGVAVRVAREHHVPYSVRGAGTNLCGGTIVPTGGLVIHLSRLNRILSIDSDRRRAWVEPGVINLHLHKALAPRGLFYAPDPASQKACTLGGNVGTNAGGPHCLKYGVTSHHVTGLEWIRPNGETVVVSVDNDGFDLTGLFVGSEGTLGLATKIEVNLLPQPEDVRTFLVAFPSMEAAAHTVTEIIAAGIVPATLEVMDRLTVQAVEAFVHAGYPTSAEAVLLIEVDGPRERTVAEGARVRALCSLNGGTDFRMAVDERERDKLWEGRRGAYAAMARLAPNVLVEDGVVPRTRLPEAVQKMRAIADRAGIRMGLIAHAGDGNLHPNMIFDERDKRETARVLEAGQEMLRVCVDLGGSISGEHGIGADKREAMRWLFTPPTLAVFREVKKVFDPDNLCNPDKLIPVVESTPGPRAVSVWPGGEYIAGNVETVLDYVRAVRDAGGDFYIKGSGTKGMPIPSGKATLVTTALDTLVDLDRANLTLVVGAGIHLPTLRARLGKDGLYLHVPGEGTLGGVLSTNARGRPPLRNQILGMKTIGGEGELLSFGAKVMKNVAGYDAARLFLGAWGTLGVMVEVTLRLYSTPAELWGPPLSGPPDFSKLSNPDLHRKVKAAFDPKNMFNPTLLSAHVD
ncbi:MAG: FAD-binding protein [Elusimicrobia bacterium]|nr:FAD-binding protein [Elusimicrobiota bacterium]